ncbi:MAG: hypothetical protein EA353_04600 [Puniceicoccaceae bacterium]|nr:MAG: hypothetical protein EA353_04600 [Puniceicoccaceae bacterium]
MKRRSRRLVRQSLGEGASDQAMLAVGFLKKASDNLASRASRSCATICRQMMTQEQKKDSERLARYVIREQLVSLMNDTKWEALRSAMIALKEFNPCYRLACLRSEPDVNWDGDWHYHLPPFKCIEWLEIDPVQKKRIGRLVKDEETDFSKEIKTILWAEHIPFSLEGGLIRIWGYQRPGTQINFEYQGSSHNSGGFAPSA